MAHSSPLFDPSNFAKAYEFLGELPDALHDAAVLGTEGTLEHRVAGLLAWRRALLEGRLPGVAEVDWPAEPIRRLLLGELASLGIARFCRSNPEVTDALLAQLVEVRSALELRRIEAVSALAEALAREERRRTSARRVRAKGVINRIARDAMAPVLGADEGGAPAAFEPGDGETIATAVRATEAYASQFVADALRKRWEEQLRVWSELEEVFGELGQLVGVGRDFARGILRSVGWLQAARLAKLLRDVPALRELVNTLGRMQGADGLDESALEKVFEPVTRVGEELLEVRTPFAPHEARGVERSDALTRMLPAEAALLRRPSLRRLWHAKRAERALLTYRVEGTASERVVTESVGQAPAMRPAARRERGPIILCIDTSGSMQGLAENVAKAIALEACRTAHREGRACLLFAFSGPGQVSEHQLSLDERGIPRLLEFLSLSFSGGTDLAAPLNEAARHLRTEAWSRCDVVVVSDGEFDVPAAARAELRAAQRERGARCHGILVGSAETESFSTICDPVHRFSSWADLAGLERTVADTEA